MPLLVEHKGRKRYALWFVDMEGNEDFLTMSLTWKQANALEAAMQQRKAKASISDFVLREDTTPDNYMQALEYLNYKLQEEEWRSA
jgi:hypothetical protein